MNRVVCDLYSKPLKRGNSDPSGLGALSGPVFGPVSGPTFGGVWGWFLDPNQLQDGSKIVSLFGHVFIDLRLP